MLTYLVYDDLDTGKALARDAASREIVRAILTRRYGEVLPCGLYRDGGSNSFRDDPVLRRPPRYIRKNR